MYYDTPAYRIAVASPFHVSTHQSWAADEDPTVVVGFQSEDEARRFASLRPEPLIDLAKRGRGVIAVRRLIQHPAMARHGVPFTPTDDFPDTRP